MPKYHFHLKKLFARTSSIYILIQDVATSYGISMEEACNYIIWDLEQEMIFGKAPSSEQKWDYYITKRDFGYLYAHLVTPAEERE